MWISLFGLGICGQGYEFIIMKSLCVRAGVTKSLPGKILQMPLSVPNSLAEVHSKHGLLVLLIGSRVYNTNLYHLCLIPCTHLTCEWALLHFLKEQDGPGLNPQAKHFNFQPSCTSAIVWYCRSVQPSLANLELCVAQMDLKLVGPTSHLPKSSSLRCTLPCPLTPDAQTCFFFYYSHFVLEKRIEFYF